MSWWRGPVCERNFGARMLSRFTEQVSERGDAAQGFGQVVAGRVGELPQVLIGAAQFGVGSFQVGRVRGDHGVGGVPCRGK